MILRCKADANSMESRWKVDGKSMKDTFKGVFIGIYENETAKHFGGLFTKKGVTLLRHQVTLPPHPYLSQLKRGFEGDCLLFFSRVPYYILINKRGLWT